MDWYGHRWSDQGRWGQDERRTYGLDDAKIEE